MWGYSSAIKTTRNPDVEPPEGAASLEVGLRLGVGEESLLHQEVAPVPAPQGPLPPLVQVAIVLLGLDCVGNTFLQITQNLPF